MKDILCSCGKTFKKLKDGRCPHCKLRIVTDRIDTFSLFVANEIEEVARIDEKGVEYYFIDRDRKGPERHGWHKWPSCFTDAQIKTLLAIQAMPTTK